jgi:hypothetical protein
MAFGLLAWLLHSDPLTTLVAGSVYLPLAPFAALGVPVFVLKGWYFPDVTLLGWAIALLLWFAFYWAIADILVRTLGNRRRVA